MIQTFIFKLILLALTLPPARQAEFPVELYNSKTNQPVPFIVHKKVFPDEHEGVLYTFKGEMEFTIHMIDNGLYKITLPGNEPFEIDMIDYFMKLDSDKIQQGKQVIALHDKKEAAVITFKDGIYTVSGLADKTYKVTLKDKK